jgi:hypothetical protein
MSVRAQFLLATHCPSAQQHQKPQTPLFLEGVGMTKQGDQGNGASARSKIGHLSCRLKWADAGTGQLGSGSCSGDRLLKFCWVVQGSCKGAGFVYADKAELAQRSA